jgi:tRNA/rRNA methyltransferase
VNPIYDQNIGYCARVMGNFGFKDLWIVKNEKIGEEATIYAKHGAGILEKAKIVKNLNDAISGCDLIIGTTAIEESGRNVLRKSITPKEMVKKITKNTAILLGNEATGLSKDELELCDLVVRIPTEKNCRALNISHALAIILYEIKCSKKTKREYLKENEKKIILDKARQLLEKFKKEGKVRSPKTILLSLRRILARGIITKIEGRAILQFFKCL